MSNQIPTHAPAAPESLKAFLGRPATIEHIQAIAPKYLSADRLVKILLLTAARDGKLVRCTPQSMLSALMRCAQFGLEPDGRLVHFIPYKDQVNVIIDWKGLVEIARRNGIECNATLVYEEDDFELLPDDGTGRCFVRHSINLRKTRTKIIGAYSRSRRIDGTGTVDYEWMTLPEIEAIRKRSPSGNDGPWVSDFGEMARKTVLRRHSKRWPLSMEDRGAVHDDDDTPREIRLRNVSVSSSPAAPVFKRALKDAEEAEDDVQYNEAPVDQEPPPEQEKPKAKPKPAPRVDPPKKAAPPTVDVETKSEPEGGIHERLDALITGDMGTTFEVFKAAIVDLGYQPTAGSWNTVEDVPEDVAAQVLNSPRGIIKAVQLKAQEMKEAE